MNGPQQATTQWRLLTFVPALSISLALVFILSDWFDNEGFTASELALMAIVAFSSFWIALSVSASLIGFFAPRRTARARPAAPGDALDVALLVPIYQEDPKAVFARLGAMRHALATTSSHHRFVFFVLSDTCDEDIATLEIEQFRRLSQDAPENTSVFYRRRSRNIDRKAGNLRDWVQNWGGDWDAFITLDADSLMSAEAVLRLCDEMSSRPGTGLIQTVPRLIGGASLFARVQQFSNNIYGPVLARGLDRWSGNDGNYWGHNAIIRTAVFARSAGLPNLSGSGPLSGTIKSHDFVEAALIRRAGWSIDMLPDVEESYEEIPQSIVDFILRDRRWCQGNLQHLRLLATAGFTAGSRFHMLQGAMAYLSSLLWFALLIVWALMGRSEQDNVFRYFTNANPLFPQWPEMDAVSRLVVLVIVIGLLLFPKILGLAATVIRNPSPGNFGGPVRFATSALIEIFMSFLLAPIMMIQHVVAVMRTIIGFDAGWAPQNRSGANYSLLVLLRFHAFEVVIGMLLIAGLFAGVVSLWLLPIAISLAGSVVLSWLSALPLPRRGWLGHVMKTSENWNAPSIILNVQRLGHDLQGSAPGEMERDLDYPRGLPVDRRTA